MTGFREYYSCNPYVRSGAKNLASWQRVFCIYLFIRLFTLINSSIIITTISLHSKEIPYILQVVIVISRLLDNNKYIEIKRKIDILANIIKKVI